MVGCVGHVGRQQRHPLTSEDMLRFILMVWLLTANCAGKHSGLEKILVVINSKTKILKLFIFNLNFFSFQEQNVIESPQKDSQCQQLNIAFLIAGIEWH